MGVDTTTTTTGDLPCEPGDMMMMGMVEKSFLWVANTDQGSLSKVDTQMLKELARYRSGPSGATESPSRTAVSIDGRFVVVNNRGTGRVTMVAANLEDCVDKNNNGMIETSQNPNDLLPWDGDECVLWSTVLQVEPNNIGAGPRAVTWTPGIWSYDACAFVEPKLWVGYRPQAGVSHMSKLDGLTGAVEETVVISPWNVGDTYWGPYGAALDKDENVWFTGLRGNLYKIETKNNNALTTIPSPGGSQFYGMTVDTKGRSWTAGCVGPVYRYDPMDQSWTAVPGSDGSCLRGIGADKDGAIWAASNGQCGVYQIDADSATVIKFHTLNPCSTPVGISVDDEGFVFVVDEWQGAWKIDPINTDNKQFLPISSEHYTYSDMTGGQLKGAILPQ
ncbi:MAG: lyase [Myxococcales bacterium]|nr:lyase [Myxococcales bacterium]